MNNFDKIQFKKQFIDMLKNSKNSVDKLVNCMLYVVNDSYDEEEDTHSEILKYNINILKLNILTYMELHGLNLLRKEFLEEYKIYEKNPSKVDYNPTLDYGWSPCLELIEQYFQAITSDIKDDSGVLLNMTYIDTLERILNGTGKIISDRNLRPESEADIRKAIYGVLIHVFPDTVREIPISKVTKIYKPDFGIKSLKVAIEYKYIANERDAKSIIGGIYEDIHGYAGSEDWKHYYAVLYMNDHYFTPAQIQAEFDMADVDKHTWKPIVVMGHGTRKQRNKFDKSQVGTESRPVGDHESPQITPSINKSKKR